MSSVHGMMDRALVGGKVQRADIFTDATRPASAVCAGVGCGAQVVWVIPHFKGKKKFLAHFRLKNGEHAPACNIFQIIGVAPKNKPLRVAPAQVLWVDDPAAKTEVASNSERRTLRWELEAPTKLSVATASEYHANGVDVAQPRPMRKSGTQTLMRKRKRPIRSAKDILDIWRDILVDIDPVQAALETIVLVGNDQVPWTDFFHDMHGHELIVDRIERGELITHPVALVMRRDKTTVRLWGDFAFASAERRRRSHHLGDWVGPAVYSSDSALITSLKAGGLYLAAGRIRYRRKQGRLGATFHNLELHARSRRAIVEIPAQAGQIAI